MERLDGSVLDGLEAGPVRLERRLEEAGQLGVAPLTRRLQLLTSGEEIGQLAGEGVDSKSAGRQFLRDFDAAVIAGDRYPLEVEGEGVVATPQHASSHSERECGGQGGLEKLVAVVLEHGEEGVALEQVVLPPGADSSDGGVMTVVDD